MRILVVNPNTTASMTRTIEAAARAAASASTTIEAVTSRMGPASIEGYYDEAFAVPGLLAEIRRGEQDGAHAEAIVLGCAGMADLAAALQREFGVPVIDGVSAVVRQAEALVSLGLSTSKRGAYALPAAKPFAGLLSQFAPDEAA